jgi:cardiolipin synthase
MIGSFSTYRGSFISWKYLIAPLLCILLAGCTISLPQPGNVSVSCQGNCTTGPGVQGVQVYVEPDAGEHPITDAINAAQKSIWLEIYILTDRNVIRALEEAVNRGVDVRVMLEPHPFGGGGSPARTMDQLRAAGAKVQESNPGFALTHEKGIPIG